MIGGPIRQLAFEVTWLEFKMRAYYDDVIGQDAIVHVTRNGVPFNTYKYPAYRIWNLAAHFTDAVERHLRDEKEAGHTF